MIIGSVLHPNLTIYTQFCLKVELNTISKYNLQLFIIFEFLFNIFNHFEYLRCYRCRSTNNYELYVRLDINGIRNRQ